VPFLSRAAARHAAPALRAALVAATLLALPTSAAPATAVTCQMLPQAVWGWTCPLSLPAAGEGGGELVLELDYTPPLRVQIAEVWEVTSPANESWQLSAWPESRSNGLFRWSPRIFSSLIGRGDMCCHEAREKSEVEPEVIEE